MNQLREHIIDGDRYAFDFKLCNYKHGWAQVDTKQDASYYGTWANPITLKLVTYCEGDLTVTNCDTEAEFITVLRECVDWNKERQYFIGIDGMCEPKIIDAFKRMGFEQELH